MHRGGLLILSGPPQACMDDAPNAMLPVQAAWAEYQLDVPSPLNPSMSVATTAAPIFPSSPFLSFCKGFSHDPGPTGNKAALELVSSSSYLHSQRLRFQACTTTFNMPGFVSAFSTRDFTSAKECARSCSQHSVCRSPQQLLLAPR